MLKRHADHQKYKTRSEVMTVTPAFGKLRQEDQ